MQSFRSDAPYLPSNVEFVARNNGIPSVDAVKKIVYDASYMVLGLGDVYLGAPCAVPLNPLHRLVVPKYNPARTFTPEGAVGLGGAYMCIYPMNSPGGYQLIGRTLPIWSPFGNRHEHTRHKYKSNIVIGKESQSQSIFSPSKPWLLDMFDEVRYFEVSENELNSQRQAFKNGQLSIKVENNTFSVRDYNNQINQKSVVEGYKNLRAQQSLGQRKQLEEDAASLARIAIKEKESQPATSSNTKDDQSSDSGCVLITGDLTAKVFKVQVQVDQEVSVGTPIATLESMKMEYVIRSTVKGRVKKVNIQVNQMVQSGQTICTILPD
jgi:urea carboxylase